MELAFTIESKTNEPIIMSVPDGAQIPLVGERIFIQGNIHVGNYIVTEREYNLRIEKAFSPANYGWTFKIKKV
ncbi:hypothetical protein [Desulfospira joergensenii]|uniref:hypothetical protein n=1 Tax=Desulfospira joergensenii TaxID=53329 RepID=UPI0003B4D27E|nr:hypothetical protein [Desulfospira joergensenii]